MGLSQISPIQKKSGGGMWGKIAGGILTAAGTVAAPMTGGASLAAGLAAAGALTSLGSSVIDPEKVSQSSALQSVANTPDSQALKLGEAKKALNSSTLPEQDRLVMNNHLSTALDTINQRRRSV